MTCRAPTLIVASAADRLLPSLEESGRLVRAIPNSQRVILPNSGHTALLESGISLARIMDRTGFLPEVRNSQPASPTSAHGPLLGEGCDHINLLMSDLLTPEGTCLLLLSGNIHQVLTPCSDPPYVRSMSVTSAVPDADSTARKGAAGHSPERHSGRHRCSHLRCP